MAAPEPNFIGTLGLNWKLFLAQLVNFGVVLFILWRWVFKPVGGALEGRRQKIEKAVRDAEEIEKRMAEVAQTTENKISKARAEADGLMAKAEKQAADIREQTVAAARIEAERMLAGTRETIENEKDKMFKEVREEVAALTVMAAEKILRQEMKPEKQKELTAEALKILK
ncbi:MAG: F0F1 ATP synthase subunit B [Candidatus Doudnabacteria bacterium]|nr:F0F1 ATP synthase subunit B [Candidatus Doudnabacteria bacterium]